MPIIKRCGDCGADITADPLTHDCPARRARIARLAAADRYRRRFLACVVLLVGILAGVAAGLVMIWKWRLYE